MWFVWVCICVFVTFPIVDGIGAAPLLPDISNKGAEAFLECLQHNSTLTSLNLNGILTLVQLTFM